MEQAAEQSARIDLAQARQDLAGAVGLAAEHLPDIADYGPVAPPSASVSVSAIQPGATTPSTAAAGPVRLQDGPVAPNLEPLNLQRQALHQRADLRLALAHYAGLEAELQGEIARQYPELSLKPGYAWDRGDNRWSVGLGAALPLAWLQSRPNHAAIDQAMGARATQAQQVRELQLRAITTLDQVRLSHTRARSELASAQERLTHAQHQVARIEQRLLAGAADRADHLAARRQLMAEVTEMDRSEAAVGRAHLALEDALQSPLSIVALRWRPDHGGSASKLPPDKR
jgi:outer membrane protein TolC